MKMKGKFPLPPRFTKSVMSPIDPSKVEYPGPNLRIVYSLGELLELQICRSILL